jgi:hypothetical protein
MTEAETAAEREADRELLVLLRDNIARSGLFRAEKIDALIHLLHTAYVPFGRLNTRIAFEGSTILTATQKRNLGLNTRRKYSREFIEYFYPESLRTIEPCAALEHMHLDAFHRVSRSKELRKLRKLGFVKKVTVGADPECAKAQALRGAFALTAPPLLPVPGCTAPFCRCLYVPVLTD